MSPVCKATIQAKVPKRLYWDESNALWLARSAPKYPRVFHIQQYPVRYTPERMRAATSPSTLLYYRVDSPMISDLWFVASSKNHDFCSLVSYGFSPSGSQPISD